MTIRIHQPDTNADNQLRKVLVEKNAFNMIAGAGSGKTTSLVKGLDYIREKFGNELKSNRQRVACITYTEIATAEIFDDVGSDKLFHVSTIHSFLWELIKPFTNEIRACLTNEINSKTTSLQEHNAKPRTRETTRTKNRNKIKYYQANSFKLDALSKFSYQGNSDIANGVLGHAEVIKLAPQLISSNALLRKIIARKYPFFFVDESQDTVEPFVQSLIDVRNEHQDFCLGFFGDQMQNIYMTGIGRVPDSFGASSITKPENFRSPKNVLKVVNKIRLNEDGLQQKLGRDFPFEGSATFFIFPQDARRSQNLRKAQERLFSDTKDKGWDASSGIYDVKILVIIHRIAANRLGFSNLYSALHDDSTNSIKSGFTEGDHWTIRPFLKVILPLAEATNAGDNRSIINVLRNSSPILNGTSPRENISPQILKSLGKSVTVMVERFNHGVDVCSILKYCLDTQIIDLDKRFIPHVAPTQENAELDEHFAELNDLLANMEPEEISKQGTVLQVYMSVTANEFIPYEKYISGNTPYDTQQGIKGAEFDRVVVVLDDDEGSPQKLYSYEKVLGLKELTYTDNKNIKDGKDNALARTNRLFYVACSRAKKDLAIVLFTTDIETAKRLVKESKMVNEGRVLTLSDL